MAAVSLPAPINRRGRILSMALPWPIGCAEPSGTRRDAVVRYVHEIQPIHDGLRRALIHLSGFALEQITKSGCGHVGHGLVESARLAFAEISDGLRSITVPDASTHHMTHLRGAAMAIESGIRTALSKTDPECDRLLHALEQ